MAQQMITLEEAAEKLGISPEEMKKRLKTDPDFKRLSQIRDGATVRFKLSAIEELARQLGMASEQDLPLAPVGGEEPGSDDFKVQGLGGAKKPKKSDDAPLDFDSSEEDVFSLAEEQPKPAPPKSSGKLTPGKPAAAPKSMSDSSVGSSDSDVRLDGDKPRKKAGDEAAVPTEEISLDFAGQGSAVIKGGSSAKLSAPRPSPSSGKLSADAKKHGGEKPPADSSEFELSLDADSDFEMQMNPDADEVELGAMPKEKGAGASSGKGGKSGINLRDPADSGIPLDKNKGKEAEEDSGSESDFELSLDSSAASSSSRLGAPKSGKLVLDADADSDSEFELTLEDSGGSSLEQAALGAGAEEAADKGDIFETDFEIPPMEESGSEAIPAESDTDVEGSDFVPDSDVAGDEPSESEVVLLGDEDEAEATAAKTSAKLKGKKGKKKADEEEVEVSADEDEDASASKALKGVKGKKRGAEAEEEEEEEAAPAGAVVERPTKPWGVVPVLLLAPTLFVVLLGAIMGYEALNTMWGYQQPRKPAAPLVRGLADTFGMELHDQYPVRGRSAKAAGRFPRPSAFRLS
jgi:hypothetical protein